MMVVIVTRENGVEGTLGPYVLLMCVLFDISFFSPYAVGGFCKVQPESTEQRVKCDTDMKMYRFFSSPMCVLTTLIKMPTSRGVFYTISLMVRLMFVEK